MDGVDLTPYLRGERKGSPHEILFWRYGNKIALRAGRWKLVRNPPWGRASAPFELYDLDADISEQDDLAEKRPEIQERLRVELERRNAEMVDALWQSRGSGAEENWPLKLGR